MAELSLINFVARAIDVIRNARSGTMAATTIQYYDWILLLDQEVELVHGSKWTLIRVLYILTRYYALVIWPFILYANVFDHDAATCHKLLVPTHILQFPFQCLAQLVMVYRAYAFTGYKSTILMLLGSCYLTLVGIELWSFLTPPVAVPDEFFNLVGDTGCYANFEDPHMKLRMAFIMFAAVLMDLVSLLVVLFRVRRMMLGRSTIAGLFVQEGLVSFAGIVVVNTVTAIGYFAYSPHNGAGIPFMFLMSNLFACRTILHLRNAGKKQPRVSSEMTNPVVRAAIARADENAGRPTKDDWTIYAHAKQ